MRFDHYHGLNAWGKKCVARMLEAVVEGTITFPNGKTETFRNLSTPAVIKTEVIGQIAGSYVDTVAPLRAYTMRNGRVLEEFVEHTIHCGGPNYYIALRYRGGRVLKQSQWTDKQIQNN